LWNLLALPSKRYKFTAKERDTESGNDYFGARYYGSTMGRFSSPDPSGLYFADPTNPQSLNLYSYAQNNPLKNIDPTGLDCVYFNDAGNGVESVDHHSDSGECGKNGGDWVNGTTSANQVQYNAQNDTFNIQSSDTWHNYNTTANAPGTQNNGTSCFGNCDTANGYSSSLKWPSFTGQIGLAGNASFWGPLTGGLFAGFIFDSHGHVGVYSGGGGGLGVGAGGSVGLQIGVSNGNGICSMGGPFGNASVSGGALGAGTVDAFSGQGDGPGGMVNGVSATLGGGGGAGASATVTGTTVTPFGSHQCVGGKTQ
jgi:RHS repeat-associated protein